MCRVAPGVPVFRTPKFCDYTKTGTNPWDFSSAFSIQVHSFHALFLTHLTFGDVLRGKQNLNLKSAHEHSSALMILSSRCYSGENGSFC
jgi:hypothetical protein